MEDFESQCASEINKHDGSARTVRPNPVNREEPTQVNSEKNVVCGLLIQFNHFLPVWNEGKFKLIIISRIKAC